MTGRTVADLPLKSGGAPRIGRLSPADGTPARRETVARLHSSSGSPSSNQRGRLVIVCGLPGSGKTTLAKHLCSDGAAVQMNPHEWMATLGINPGDREVRAKIEALQWQISQDLLRQAVTVVIEWGTWAKVERDTLRMGARELGAAVELWYLDVEIDELWRRAPDSWRSDR